MLVLLQYNVSFASLCTRIFFRLLFSLSLLLLFVLHSIDHKTLWCEQIVFFDDPNKTDHSSLSKSSVIFIMSITGDSCFDSSTGPSTRLSLFVALEQRLR